MILSGYQRGHRGTQRCDPDEAALCIPSWEALTIENVANHERLFATFRELKSRAGRSPGVDRISFSNLCNRDAAECCRAYSLVLRHATSLYRPQPSRLVRIPKSSGQGMREIAIRTVFDRVVTATLNRAISPLWEQMFLPMSHGFRPNRGVWSCLAELRTIVERENRWILATDDIRHAFASVRIVDLLRDHEPYVKDTRVRQLIESVVRGGNQAARARGIEQGDPYSPTALNVRLHFAHDLPVTGQDRVPRWLRYADNLVYLCQSVQEGTQVLNRSRKLLARAGMALKGHDGPPVDLKRGDSARLLGFDLSRRDGRLHFGLADESWRGLEQSLREAHMVADPPEAARAAVDGWLSAIAPALETSETPAIISYVLTTAAKYGFRENTSRETLQRQTEHLHLRWRARVNAMRVHDAHIVRDKGVGHGGSAAQ